jgi:hypothetical protein
LFCKVGLTQLRAKRSAGFPAIYGRQPLYFEDETFAARAAIPPPKRRDSLSQRDGVGMNLQDPSLDRRPLGGLYIDDFSGALDHLKSIVSLSQ